MEINGRSGILLFLYDLRGSLGENGGLSEGLRAKDSTESSRLEAYWNYIWFYINVEVI